ncbi:MAG: hypothetical protein RL662_1312 [Bacteroidota bacterium]|jgi:O-succinylbenzoic acid--CoA ligase
MFNFDINKQVITIEGRSYSPDVFRDGHDLPDFQSRSPFHTHLFVFLKEWFSDTPNIRVQTSGSTGKPKSIEVQKQKMMQSAALTCSYLGLQCGCSTLLCMPLQYIGAKMLVVRSLIAALDLHLATPSGNPLRHVDYPISFVAMTPLQVFNTLQLPIEKERLSQIDTVIIGGGSVDTQLQNLLKDLPNKIYSTYGMTETLSHIALRRLNGADASDHYIPFDGVLLSLSDQQTLIIDARHVCDDRLYTTDVAEIYPDGSFSILGRKDNIINSGGIKIQIEELESLLKPYINCMYAIISLPDPKFGEIIVLVVENTIADSTAIFNHLPTYYVPKKIVQIPSIPLTETGKIDRATLKKAIATSYK